MSDSDYISNFFKEHDRDRYLASLVLPGEKRAEVQALFAFAADVAAVPARVSEPGPGEIRLQWWRDMLEGKEHGTVSGNPLAAAIREILDKYEIPATPLVRLVAARRFDLYQDPMPDAPTFEGYAGETVSVLYHYAAMILADGQEPETGDAAGHLGVAHALIGHMRAFSFNAAHGRIYLPMDRFASEGVSEQQIFAGQPSNELAQTFTSFRDMASNHLGKSRDAISLLPKKVRPAFAAIAFLQPQLKRIKAPFTDAGIPADIADWQKIARLTWWMLRNG